MGTKGVEGLPLADGSELTIPDATAKVGAMMEDLVKMESSIMALMKDMFAEYLGGK